MRLPVLVRKATSFFLDSSSSVICTGQLDWGESLLAPSLPAFTVVVPFQMGGSRSLQDEGRKHGQLPSPAPLPSSLPRGAGKGGSLELMSRQCAVRAALWDPWALEVAPPCLFWQLRKASSTPPSGCLRGRKRKGQRRWWRLRLEAAVCERRGWQGWRQKVVDFLVHLTPWLTVLMTFNYKGHCHGCSPTLLCLTCAMRKQP